MKSTLIAAAFALLAVPAVANAAQVTYYDPGHWEGEPAFKTATVAPNSANAAAAKADVARYAAAKAELSGASSGAVLGTHDAGKLAPQLVTTYDPSADAGAPRFSSTVVIPNPANAAAALADAAPYASERPSMY